ncbi:MAG: TIGR02217 family protein [Bdellovibrionales bacterium]
MSFDEIQIPLPVGFGSSGGPGFSTEVVVIDSGYERRNQNWSQARRSFDARTGIRSAADAGTLLNFFHARAGRARGFRLKDWSDCTSAPDGVSAPGFDDQIIGTGDGTALNFQLVKNYASAAVTHARTITKPVVGSIRIGVNGIEMATGWSADTTTGVVTFAEAPPDGHAITAGFRFDVPVRFDTDQLSLTAQNFRLYRTEIPIVEIRV